MGDKLKHLEELLESELISKDESEKIKLEIFDVRTKLTELKELLNDDLLTEFEYFNNLLKIDERKEEIDVKLTTDYYRLKTALSNEFITEETFKVKVNKVKDKLKKNPSKSSEQTLFSDIANWTSYGRSKENYIRLHGDHRRGGYIQITTNELIWISHENKKTYFNKNEILGLGNIGNPFYSSEVGIFFKKGGYCQIMVSGDLDDFIQAMDQLLYW